MSVYPKWLYHKTLGEKCFNSEEEHGSLGKGWEETPAAFDQEQDETTNEQKESDQQESASDKKTEIKDQDLVALKVAELRDILIAKGKTKEELKGLQKDELIALIGSL